MVSRLEKVDAVVGYEIHDSMFLRQAPRPCAGREIFQRLRLADPREWIPHDGFDDFQRAQCNPSIHRDPVPQVLPKFGLKYCCSVSVLRGHAPLLFGLEAELIPQLIDAPGASFP